MKTTSKTILLILGLLLPQTQLFSQSATVYHWLDDIARDVQSARALAAHGDWAGAQSTVLRTYLDRFETLEAYYGVNAKYGVQGLAQRVHEGEISFHALMQTRDAQSFEKNAAVVAQQVQAIRAAVAATGVEIVPEAESTNVGARAIVAPHAAKNENIRATLQMLSDAGRAYHRGDASAALTLVERAYLEGFEPMESRLPGDVVDRVEKTIHIELRPAIKRNADAATVTSLIGTIGDDLLAGDRFLAKGTSAGFAAFSAFMIIVREGLEAVLLIAALLAYLGAIGAQAKHRHQIYAGVAAGVLGSIGTWFVAVTLLPISGANRELLEGITALLAVVVLLYVANWLFQKTYIHDWKDYLRTRVGGALSSGSTFAMAALAFAAVYREGFETVLFYQALSFDAGVAPILGGFIPGMLLIIVIGLGIIRAGMKLPLKKVFTWTNAVLMYLAFVFIGKGLYNLQEAGLFSVHPLPLPDHPALRQLLGFYPVIETLAAQLAFLLLLTATYMWYRRKMKPALSAPVQQTAQPPEQHAEARPA